MSGLMVWKKQAGEPGVADTCSPSQTYTQRKPEWKWLQATGEAYLWKPFCLYYLSPRSENYSCIFLSKVHVTRGYKINSHEEVTLADHWYHFKAFGNTTPSVQRKRTKQRRYALPCWSTDSMCGSPGSQRAYPGKFQTGFFTEIFTSLILYVQHCFPCGCNRVIKQLKERRVCFGLQLEGTVCRGPKGLKPRVRGCWSHWIHSQETKPNVGAQWLSPFFFFSLGPLPRSRCHSYSGLALSSSVNRHTQYQSCDS